MARPSVSAPSKRSVLCFPALAEPAGGASDLCAVGSWVEVRRPKTMLRLVAAAVNGCAFFRLPRTLYAVSCGEYIAVSFRGAGGSDLFALFDYAVKKLRASRALILFDTTECHQRRPLALFRFFLDVGGILGKIIRDNSIN